MNIFFQLNVFLDVRHLSGHLYKSHDKATAYNNTPCQLLCIRNKSLIYVLTLWFGGVFQIFGCKFLISPETKMKINVPYFDFPIVISA